jgi:aminopeptidase-like protein
MNRENEEISKIYRFGKKIFPYLRSLTGPGTYKTLIEIQKQIPKLKINFFKSGSKVFDWTIPPEWNIKEAYLLDHNNKKLLDIKNNNLHIVNPSKKINQFLTFNEIKKNLHYLKENPTAIPYITSYYKTTWGFCLSYNYYKKLEKYYSHKKNSNKKIKVVINSSFNPNGKMNFGEAYIKGKFKEEILISTNICHPQMANNELSGPMCAILLYNYFKTKKNFKSIRFLFLPETIGSIAYLSKNLKILKKNVYGGYVLSCIGDNRNYTYLKTKNAESNSDKAALKIIKDYRIKARIKSFLIDRGSDERQYNSPGIDLNIGGIMRTMYREYKEYHTSDDDFNLVTTKGIRGGYNFSKKIIELLIKNYIPIVNTKCEPMLSKRGLYSFYGKNKSDNLSRNILNVLQCCDGSMDTIEISNRLNLDINSVFNITNILSSKKLISFRFR